MNLEKKNKKKFFDGFLNKFSDKVCLAFLMLIAVISSVLAAIFIFGAFKATHVLIFCTTCFALYCIAHKIIG